jgi:hypothetical protein
MMIRSRIVSAWLNSLAMAIALLAPGACRFTTDAPKPHVLGIVAGDGQTTPAGAALPEALVVIVIDQYGFTEPNIIVSWAITSGGGSLSAAATATDVDGTTSVTYTAGPAAGTATITATIPGIGSVTFTATIT